MKYVKLTRKYYLLLNLSRMRINQEQIYEVKEDARSQYTSNTLDVVAIDNPSIIATPWAPHTKNPECYYVLLEPKLEPEIDFKCSTEIIYI